MADHAHDPLRLRGAGRPLLRDPLDVLRLTFLVAAIVFLAVGSTGYGIRLAGTFAVLLVARRLRLPRTFDLLFIFAMALQAWGNAGRLFEEVGWWDDVVHFTLPAASVPVLYQLSWRLGLVRDITEMSNPRLRLGFVVFAMLAGLAIGSVYEIYEYGANRWLGVDLAVGYADTIEDLTMNAGGAFVGGLLLLFWSEGRLPTEDPREP